MFKTQKEIVEEEFDKEFPDTTHTSCANKEIPCGTMKNSIKSFLHSIRAADKEAVMEMIENALQFRYHDNSKDDEIAMKRNQILSDLLTHLKNNWIV